MRKLHAKVATLVVPALLLAGPALAQEVKPQIEAAAQAWEDAYNGGDAVALGMLYAEDAMALPPGSEPLAGRAAIQASFAADMEMGGEIDLEVVDVMHDGDMVVEVGKWTATGADGSHLDHGNYMVTWVRTADGWRIKRDMWNSNMGM